MSARENSPEISDRTTGTPGSSSYTPPVAPEAAQNIPYPMHPGMPFFANPFMSPFMPQQPADVPAATSTASPSGFVFSPAQYQEMMQQYFQQMMMASQFGHTMPFPMPFAAQLPVRPASQASQADSINEAINVLRSTNISENGHHEIPTATVAPIVPQSDSSDGSPEKSCFQEVTNADAECPERSMSPEQESHSTASKPDSGGEERKPSENEKTVNLIKKQMTDFEKEMLRRSQNKNIKQIDDRELADLIGDSEQFVATNFAPEYSQSGLSYTPPAPEQPASTPAKSLNQLRSSFNLPESGPTTGPAITANSFNAPIQQAPFAAPLLPSASGFVQQPVVPPTMINDATFINPFGQPQYHPAQSFNTSNGDPNFTQELAASFMPQPVTPEEVQTAASTVSSGALGLAPPPPPSHPVHRKTSAPSTSSLEWPEENKENGDEPVWVLRDSYMKRLKRDEAAAQASEMHSVLMPETTENGDDESETDRLICDDSGLTIPKKKSSKETTSSSPSPSVSNSHIDQIALVHEPAVLIEGVLFRARYLGSTQMMCETRSSKAARMHQAQEAVARVKAPDGEIQPSTEIDLFISTEKIMVLNTDLQRISETDVRQDILMDHALRTISYIADIGDLVVLMARRMSASDSDEQCNQVEGVKRTPKVICHVFESDEASFIAQSIGQAFQVAYVEFLRANGIDDPSYLRQIDYQEVLNSQELMGDELELFARKETQKDVVVPKKSGEPLGIVVVESGWGSMLPTVVLAHMNPIGPAARSNLLNIGDQIININGISLVGLPLSAAQTNIKNMKTATAVRLTVVSTPPVVEVRIRRPDTKYQLGFSVQNGVICSLLRGGIAERGGIRVGHRIIEINGQSVVAVAHDRIVNMLATAIGEIHMKTMPTSMFRLLTGQEVPQYI